MLYQSDIYANRTHVSRTYESWLDALNSIHGLMFTARKDKSFRAVSRGAGPCRNLLSVLMSTL